MGNSFRDENLCNSSTPWGQWSSNCVPRNPGVPQDILFEVCVAEVYVSRGSTKAPSGSRGSCSDMGGFCFGIRSSDEERPPSWDILSKLPHHSNGRTLSHVIFKFGLAIHPNDHQARRRFVEWAPNEIAVVPYFHKRILFSDEAHFWLNGYVNKQNCRIWSEANPQVYVETLLHPEKLTVW
ncbi:hypothetical protein TNCV_202611 [Trichonephila clavipes]|nr:hypothetical protein TNCV_202611 [Trichonephila clavipes]